MDTTIDLIRGIVTLDEKTYRAFLTSENVMKSGFLIMLACLFIGTFPVFGQSLINNIRGFTPEMAAESQEQFLTIFKQFQPPDVEDEFLDMFKQNFIVGSNMGVELDALPSPLPRPISAFFRALGAWITAALRTIGPWLGYGALVLLFAKLAGGRAILNPFYGLTALFAIPGLLRIFSFVPYLGPVLGLVGLIWGIAVYIRAVQISQDFSGGKAVLITFLPVLILLLLGLCMGSVALGSLIGALSGA
jgi:hypothetical protein